MSGTEDVATLLGLAFCELVARRVLVILDTGRVRPGPLPLTPGLPEVLLRTGEAALSVSQRHANTAWIADRLVRDAGHPKVWARRAIWEPLTEIGCAVNAERTTWGITWHRNSYVRSAMGLHQVHLLSQALDALDFEELDQLAATQPAVALALITALGEGLLLVPELYPVARVVAITMTRDGRSEPTIGGLHLANLRGVSIRDDVGRYDLLHDD